MKNQKHTVRKVIDYIEEHLEEKLNLDVYKRQGVMCAYIDDQHPRGQGTVDVIVVGTAGEASEELVRKAQAAARCV